MTTIMEDNECSNQEEACEHGKWDAQPERDILHEIHHNPERKDGDEGVHDLPYGTPNMRLLEIFDEGFPFLVAS